MLQPDNQTPQPHDPTAELRARRLATLREIAEQAEYYGLPTPMAVNLWDHGHLHIRLDNNQRAGVYAWAAHLHLPVQPDHHYDASGGRHPFTSVKAEKSDTGGAWLGWDNVQVWSACDRDGDES